MRILFCCEFYAPSVGGAQEVVRQIAERLAARGHEVTVATSALPERRFRDHNGVRIQEFHVAGNAVWGMEGEVEAYQRFLRSEPRDVVSIYAAQQWTFDAAWPVLEQAAQRRFFTPCGFSSLYEPAYARYFEVVPEVLRRFDGLVFHATDYRDARFAREQGLDVSHVIPNGADEREFGPPADPAFRTRQGIPEEDFLLLTVGSLTGVKGHWEVLQAFDRLDLGGRHATLLLVGAAPSDRRRGMLSQVKGIVKSLAGRSTSDADPARACRALASDIQRRSTNKRVLLADLPRPEVVQAFHAADLFVFASHIEYSPIVLYESCAAGTPFLSVPVGNAEEIARWTGGGEICRAATDDRGYTHADPGVLAEAIASLLREPAKRRSLGDAGRRAWNERYTWGTVTQSYERLFQGEGPVP